MISRRMMMNDKIVTESGEQLVLEKCKGSYFNGFSVYGKSEQVQTTGAQLYNPALWDALIERPDVKIVNHMDGSFEVSGSELTSALSYSHVYTHEETLDMFSVGDNVYLDANDTKTGIWFNIMFIKNGVNYSPKNGLTQEDLSDPTLKAKQVIFGNTGTKIIPGLVRPMLSKIKDADWEPYTGGKPSPSPEYPQAITTAGDKGTLEVKVTDSGEKSQRFIIQTPNGLPGIPVKSGGNYTDETGQQWVCDEIDFKNGERVQRIGECVFDGSEDWFADYISNQATKRYRTRIPDIIRKKQPDEALCSHFSFAGYSDDRIGFFLTANNADFYLKTMFETVDELKKWLSNNNVTVKYILETPIRTPLSPEEITAYKALHTYSPNTTIVNDGGCGMSVEYVADTKTYIKAVEDKITAIQAALINQNISGGGYNGR